MHFSSFVSNGFCQTNREHMTFKNAIRKDELQVYSFIIILRRGVDFLYGFIENVVLNQSIPVFFIGSTVSLRLLEN